MATNLASVLPDITGWYRISCKYDPAFQSDLKDAVGRGNWSYQPSVRMWYVREACAKIAVAVLKGHGYQVETTLLSTITQDNPWIAIFESLPEEQARSMYRKAISVVHGDVSGLDDSYMKDLQNAWEEVNREEIENG